MRKNILIPIVVLSFLTFSCKSLVTQKDVLKQKKLAEKAVNEAQEELLDLAKLKEQYSVDRGIAEIEKLRKKQKTIDKDIDKIEGLKGAGTIEAAENILDDLKTQSSDISTRISIIENTPRESWQAAIDLINRDINALQHQIALMTNNVR